MIALSAFMPEIALAAPGIADIVAYNYIRNAAIKFCNLTQCVTETLDTETYAAGTEEFDISVSSSEEIVAITAAYVDGEPIDPTSEQELKRLYGAWKTKTGTPKAFLSTAAALRLFPLPVSDVSIELTVAKRPTRVATSLADVLNTEWREAIIAGALGQILLLPKQPFTDAALAAIQQQQFNDWLITGQAKAFKQTQYAPLRVECA